MNTNPREVIRRFLKIFLLSAVLYLTLLNNGSLSRTDIFQIMAVNIIIYCIIDSLYPSISPIVLKDNDN